MSFTDNLLSLTAPLRERAVKVLPGGITRSTLFVAPHPPYAVSGDGAWVTDSTGHRVIDCNNNYTSLIHGHNNPEVMAAAAAVMTGGTAFGLPTEAEIDFAELLSQRVGLPSWRFCNSGTEAVMMAVRAARAYTGRDLLVRFEGSYHGTSDAVVASDSPGIPRGLAADVAVLPQADAETFTALMRRRGSDVAAVLIDLMPNRAGLVPATQEFAELVRSETERHGALMIVDEVITLRLGIGGLHQRYGITPDLVTAAKIIGGGFPAGALGGRAEVLEPFNPLGSGRVGWGGTFSANPVTLRAGQRAMELFDAAAIERLNALGDELRQGLVQAGVTATGFGSLTRLHHPQTTGLWWKLYEKGVLAGTNGLIALSTPMDTTDTAHILEAIVSSYKELA
ncbi:aspartate aminotransferase family protein [Arthrobacter mobilis]|uniref:Aminotransferase class III-fold pyridoxal phosphate-dependent enzyme n=1 Tax=Arthrobacter mobilis TaxID=2724944 RepID=A0A7X6K578_9MICC|nr:aminotransferase class III-fold pyridoxal phosphate-dependent enzyme [Arthrobacter mobilis]NKX55420.1 aminotransferase class III-fold pyridoxal phosphate-dependent enzyme [Arthrobacter mobilis]